ncbi:MAG: tryptophan--tRNA ligase [Bdellovibrionales bacterium]
MLQFSLELNPRSEVHIGNYLGAIQPAIKLANSTAARSLLFIADYHSHFYARDVRASINNVAATWIASGLDTEKSVIYKQSIILKFLVQWILSCFTPKGFMNRAHAYKAKIDENKEAGKKDLDSGINMGLYNYPVLMTADILMFNSTHVPVGEDQLQHLEFARDIAQKFNNNYGETFVLPEPISQKGALIPGLDGRKMSKSYNNSIPLFLDSKKLRKK